MASFDEFFDGQFSSDLDIRSGRATSKTLVIASTPRSGSHMLGQTLQRTGLFGIPLEYMQPTHIERWKRKYAAGDPPTALRKLMEDRTSSSGVFSIKLHYSHLRALGGISMLREIFPDPRVVLIRRRDTLRQAVSHAIAHQSGVWIGDTADEAALTYDPTLINWALTSAIRDTANWRYDVIRSGFPFEEIDSEDVVDDAAGAVLRVGDLLGVAVPQDALPDRVATRKQASGINDDWIRRFQSEAKLSMPAGLPRPRTLGQRVVNRTRRVLGSRK